METEYHVPRTFMFRVTQLRYARGKSESGLLSDEECLAQACSEFGMSLTPDMLRTPISTCINYGSYCGKHPEDFQAYVRESEDEKWRKMVPTHRDGQDNLDKPKCTCGVDSIRDGGLHRSWCDKK